MTVLETCKHGKFFDCDVCENEKPLLEEIKRLEIERVNYARCHNALADVMTLMRDRMLDGRLEMNEILENVFENAEKALEHGRGI